MGRPAARVADFVSHPPPIYVLTPIEGSLDDVLDDYLDAARNSTSSGSSGSSNSLDTSLKTSFEEGIEATEASGDDETASYLQRTLDTFSDGGYGDVFNEGIFDTFVSGSAISSLGGVSNVIIGGRPAWRAEKDTHFCPWHGPGKVLIETASKTVFINGFPACRQGDIVREPPREIGIPNVIIGGCMSVFIGG
jgi:uncharacterized Zn-binding protein involved in type VI secretion